MADLRIGLLQQASLLDRADNRAYVEQVGHLLDGLDVAVLPEAFARDFGEPGSSVAAFAEPLDGPFVTTLHAVAARHGTAMVAGMFEGSPDPERPFNTVVVVDASGLRASYRKIHLYDSFGFRESDRLKAGEVDPVVVSVAGWTLGVMTCYDLRFPELARDLVARGAEALVVPSAWVAGPRKVLHWRTLITARAIENTAYVVAVDQPGPRYCGTSLAVAPDGDVVTELGAEPASGTATLRSELLASVREQNPSLANRRF